MGFFRNLFRGNQRGSVSVTAVLSLTVLMGFAGLAVDLGYIQMKKSDLQTAADAAALAGAQALVSYGDDLTAVRAQVLDLARKNLSAHDLPNLAVTNEDIIFMRDGMITTNSPNQVEVTVGRTTARGNPISLFLGPVLSSSFGQARASSRAGVVATCASKCVLPIMVPTKFTWDDYADPDKKYEGNGEMDVESPAELASVSVQGYKDSDIGTQITLKIGDPNTVIVSSHYNAIDLPPVNKGTPVTGGDAFRGNWARCDGSNNVTVEVGDEIQLEPGNMVGPTKQGVNDLLALDPYATWDSGSNTIQNSLYADPMASPRVGIIAFYDPSDPPVSGRTTLMAYQLGAIFVESVSGQGEVTGRFLSTFAKNSDFVVDGDCLLVAARLMQDSTR